MSGALVLVVDGLGVGAMPDAGELRPGDVAADTLGSLASWSGRERDRRLRVPHLSTLGLVRLRPDLAGLLPEPGRPGQRVSVRRAALGYPGADTFAGHQTMMGADMSHVTLCLVEERAEQLTAVLRAAGHTVEPLGDRAAPLVVDGVALVHDNLEADPALNWNVSARLVDLPFEQTLAIARIVRSVAPVARVIAVGGRSEQPLPASVRPGPGGTLGLDTPASGFYRLGGLQVQHLGAEIDHAHQLPQAAADAGLPVTLVGKAADILEARGARVDRLPGVETGAILADTLRAVRRGGLTVTNVQQTDLAGHQQDPGRYVDLLEQVDAALPALCAALGPDDLLVVTGDHGNDPTIGHAFHTREHTPVIAVHGARDAAGTVLRRPDLASLADVGASVAGHLGLPPEAIGHGRCHRL
ncbi:MAG TPA: phosphopentomutase [Cellulomonas sp.]